MKTHVFNYQDVNSRPPLRNFTGNLNYRALSAASVDFKPWWSAKMEETFTLLLSNMRRSRKDMLRQTATRHESTSTKHSGSMSVKLGTKADHGTRKQAEIPASDKKRRDEGVDTTRKNTNGAFDIARR